MMTHTLDREVGVWAMPSARAATPSGLSRFAASCKHHIAIAVAGLLAGLAPFVLILLAMEVL